MTKKIFFATLSFLGWILSPFTWWNDALVNLPLAYVAASIINRVLPRSFLPAFLISYWATNILGILLLYIGAKHLTAKELLRNRKGTLLAALVIYSIISALLIMGELIKPF